MESRIVAVVVSISIFVVVILFVIIFSVVLRWMEQEVRARQEKEQKYSTSKSD